MRQTAHPLVTVVTPVYNGEKLLGECIESVLAQTYPNFEYLIVNNRSTDGTLEVAQRYAKQDPRVRVHTNTDFLSVVDNFNNAFSLVCEKGTYIKVIAADDWLYPNCIEEMVRVAEEHPTVGLVSSYVLSGSRVGFDGLDYPSTFVPGREAGRRYRNDLLVSGGEAIHAGEHDALYRRRDIGASAFPCAVQQLLKKQRIALCAVDRIDGEPPRRVQ